MKTTISGKVLFLLSVLALLCSTGCSDLKEIRRLSVTSMDVASLSIKGLDSIQAELDAVIDNPARDISVSALEGTVYRSGKKMGTFSALPFTVAGRTEDTVGISCRLDLDPSVSPLALLSIAGDFDIKDYTADITVKAKVGKSPARKFTMKDIPLEEIIKRL